MALVDEQKKSRDDGVRDKGGHGDGDVGHALRSVYSNTVNEEIPSELLDLLGKLD